MGNKDVLFSGTKGKFNQTELESYIERLYHFLVFPSEKAMAPHSSTLAWKIPWTEEPGRVTKQGGCTERGGAGGK